MASSSQGMRTVIQVVLAVAILVLGYFLYESITEPWEEVERERELTDLTRVRMAELREAIRTYEQQEERFPGTLDSLLMWLEADPGRVALVDSALRTSINPDSLLYSPRSGERFVYAVNDTGRVAIYLIKDPNSEDQIGSEVPDVTLLHAASWE